MRCIAAGEVAAGGEQGSAEGGRQTLLQLNVASSMLNWPSVFSWTKSNLQKALLLHAARGEAERPAAASATGPNSTADQFVFHVLHVKGSCPNNKCQVDNRLHSHRATIPNSDVTSFSGKGLSVLGLSWIPFQKYTCAFSKYTLVDQHEQCWQLTHNVPSKKLDRLWATKKKKKNLHEMIG